MQQETTGQIYTDVVTKHSQVVTLPFGQYFNQPLHLLLIPKLWFSSKFKYTLKYREHNFALTSHPLDNFSESHDHRNNSCADALGGCPPAWLLLLDKVPAPLSYISMYTYIHTYISIYSHIYRRVCMCEYKNLLDSELHVNFWKWSILLSVVFLNSLLIQVQIYFWQKQ